jgi:hypothetical protein
MKVKWGEPAQVLREPVPPQPKPPEDELTTQPYAITTDATAHQGIVAEPIFNFVVLDNLSWMRCKPLSIYLYSV